MAEGPAAKFSQPVSAGTGQAFPDDAGLEDVSASRKRRDLDEALAAEYVAGVLDADELVEAEARLRAEPGFAARVARWQLLMTPDDHAHAVIATETMAQQPMPALRRTAPRRRGNSLGDLISWFGGALFAAALVLAAIAISAPPRTSVVARLAAADNRLAYEVTEFGEALRVSRVAGKAAGKGMVHELWLIAPGIGPVSLGVLEAEPLIIPRPEPVPGLRLGISLEPQTGSSAPIPTGPMILIAELGGKT